MSTALQTNNTMTDSPCPSAITPIKRALISVSDKTGLEALAKTLSEQGVALISTGGTAGFLKDLGHDVQEVQDITKFPEMMNGRVKTLHPAIHGGLLALRDNDAHMQALETHNMQPIDLLVVNLYPFEATRMKTDDVATLIENIDIGGPAMIRAAAKNHASVAVVTDTADYANIIPTIREKGGLSHATRRTLAAKAYARTASYDASVSAWMQSICETEEKAKPFPAHLLDSSLRDLLSYGENPHQHAALYQRQESTHGLAGAKQLSGKPISYNNVMDADQAHKLVHRFVKPACVIVKHGNPCGTATGNTLKEAFEKALASDPQSAFGGVIAFNKPFNLPTAEAIGKLFVEVITAPEIAEDAAHIIQEKKPKLRLLQVQHGTSPLAYDGLQVKSVSGGFLVQTADNLQFDASRFTHATNTPISDAQQEDLLFAFEVVRSVSSNAIVLAKNGQTIGVGAGQMSRVDSVAIAIEHAARYGHDTEGAVLASDAFFPFADNVELAAKAGISAIIQPGGSMRDAEVIESANQHGIAMAFTHSRHFRH